MMRRRMGGIGIETPVVVVTTPEEVLETLMNDGTIDAIRSKIINQLKANEQLKNSAISMVERSKVLNTPGAEKHTKRELFEAIRHELQTPVLEMASKSVWELILDNNGVGKEINETVEKVYYKLSGQEPPSLAPAPTPPPPTTAPPAPPPPPPEQAPSPPPPPPPPSPPPPSSETTLEPLPPTSTEIDDSAILWKKRSFADMNSYDTALDDPDNHH